MHLAILSKAVSYSGVICLCLLVGLNQSFCEQDPATKEVHQPPRKAQKSGNSTEREEVTLLDICVHTVRLGCHVVLHPPPPLSPGSKWRPRDWRYNHSNDNGYNYPVPPTPWMTSLTSNYYGG